MHTYMLKYVYAFIHEFMAILWMFLNTHKFLVTLSTKERIHVPFTWVWVILWLICNYMIMAEMMLHDFWGQFRRDYAGSALFTRILAQKPWVSMEEVQLPWGSQVNPAHCAQATPSWGPREPNHQGARPFWASCVCLDSWPTGSAKRKTDCHMQLNWHSEN